MPTGTVLIIEDEPMVLAVFTVIFKDGPYAVRSATTFQEVLDVLEGLEVPLVVLVDENFPGGNGAQIAKILREKIPGVKLISTSSNSDEDIVWDPDARFQKPVVLKDLVFKVEKLMTA